jgi:hypothetical protein
LGIWTTDNTLGDGPEIPLTDELVALRNLWHDLDQDEQAAILTILRGSIPKS